MVSKGLGYTIEGFLALIIIFAFVLTAIPETHTGEDWNEFQEKVMAQDISHVMKDAGHLDKFVKRGEVGSIETVSNTFADSRLDVSGSISELPVSERDIGFHILKEDIKDGIETEPVSTCDEELTEIDSEHDILKAERHNTNLYIADTDPEISGGFDGEENYDTVWVDNSTECILENSVGPFYIDDFFFWGNSTGEHYKLEDVKGSGDNVEIDVHKASQIVRIKDEVQMNDFNPDVNFNTFSSEDTEIGVFDAVVLRDELEYIDEQEEELIDYMKDGSMLLMADLTDDDLDNQLDFTGLRWVDMSFESGSPSQAEFTEFSDSQNLGFLFDLYDGDTGEIQELGGTVSSGESSYMTESQLVSSDSNYESEEWGSENNDMDVAVDIPSGLPDTDCPDDHYHGEFDFPDLTADVYTTHLGNCNGVWGASIDLNGDNSIDIVPDKGLITGDTVSINEREYRVITDPDQISGCDDQGECVKFVFAGETSVELVNYKTNFEETNIDRFARIHYSESYNEDELKMINALILHITEQPKTFGSEDRVMETTSVSGTIGEDEIIPYKLVWRWHP